MTVWMVIPTANRHNYLPTLADGCGLPPDRIVLVNSGDTAAEIPGAHHLADTGPLNIQRWWNTGIDYAAARGATKVALVNDDVTFGPDMLPLLAEAIDATGAALAYPGWDPNPRELQGACFMLDLSSTVRPDERFRWWYGDTDMEYQAKGAVVRVNAPFEHHHPNESTRASDALRSLAWLDQVTFRGKWKDAAGG